jgi:hypothetical protein
LSSLTSSSAPQQALLVGISQYHLFEKLRATDDVSGMQQALASPTICAYPPERISVLEETAATREAILTSLDELCRQASAPGSRTFFYFSGHGSRDERGASYLVAVDSSKADLAGTAISAQELARRLDRCAGEVTVVLDCCYAGGMADAIARTELDAFSEALRQAMGAQNRVLFAACRPHGQAGISRDAPYGRFTGHMIDGLRGKASTDGLDVTVLGLFNYVSKHAVHSSGKVQHPSFIANIETDYPLTRYPEPIKPSVVFEKDVFLLYDREDAIQRDWIERTLQPELARNECTVWDYDPLGSMVFDIEEAIVKCKYVVVLITPAYLRNRMNELKATMALMQAVETRTPRFLTVKTEPTALPYHFKLFAGLDLSDANLMGRKREMERLIKRLKKEPHLR